MPKKRHTQVGQIFKLAVTGLPQSCWMQPDLPEKLATLVDHCVQADRIAKAAKQP